MTVNPSENQPMLAAKYVWPGIALFFLVLTMKGSVGGDIWFLLLAGQYVLDHGQVPHHEFYMYTAAGKPDVFGGWGYGLLMELAKRIFGIPAMSLLNAAMWSSVFLAAVAALRARLGKSLGSPFSLTEFTAIVLTLYVVYYSVVIRTNLRPEVTMYAVWFIGVLLFETGRRRQNFTRAQWLFPLLLWVEAWLHTAGIILLLLPLAYMAEDFIDRLFYRRQAVRVWLPAMLRWAVSILACIILPILNPNGAAQIYLHVLLMLSATSDNTWGWLTAASGVSELPLQHIIPITNILEYRPAWAADPSLEQLRLLGGFTIVLLLVSGRGVINTFMLLPLSILGALHIRGLGLWALALFVPLAALLVKTGEQIAQRVPPRRTAQASALILLLTCAALLKIGVASNGLRWPENHLPLQEGTAAIRSAYPTGGNIFCSYLVCAPTAYVIGQKYKTTLGGHIMFMWPETREHYASVLNGKTDWREQLDHYGVIAAVVEAYDPESTALSPIGLNLAHSPDWRLVAAEREAMSFVRLQPTVPRLTPEEQLVQIMRYWQAVVSETKKLQGVEPDTVVEQAESKAKTTIKLAKLYIGSPEEGIALMIRNKNEILALQARTKKQHD